MESADAASLKIGADTNELKGASAALDAVGNSAEQNAKKVDEFNKKLAESSESLRKDGYVKASSAEGMARMAEGLGKMSEGATTAGSSLAGLAGTITLVGGAVVGLVKFTFDAIEAFKRLEDAQTHLSSMLQIVGDRAGITADQIGRLADEMQGVTRFDTRAITEASTTLLRFGNATGETFERALKASADLATAMGTDIPHAAEIVGRALENAYGVQMLRRMGLITDAQVEYLKQLRETGDQARYAAEVLSTLEGIVGGLSEKVGDSGLTSATIKLKNEMGTLMENIGGGIVHVTKLDEAIASMAKDVRELNEVSSAEGFIHWLAKIQSGFPGFMGIMGKITEAFTRPDQPKAPAEPDPLATAIGGAEQWAANTNAANASRDLKFVNDLTEATNKLATAQRTAAQVSAEVHRIWDAGGVAAEKLAESYGNVDKAAEAAVAAFVKVKKAQESAADKAIDKAAAAQAAEYEKLATVLSGVTKEQQFYEKGLETLAKTQALDVWGIFAAVIAKQGQALEAFSPEALDAAKQTELLWKMEDLATAAYEKQTQAIIDQAKKEEEHAKTLGLSATALLELRINTEETTLAKLEFFRADQEYINSIGPEYVKQLEDRIAAQKKLVDALHDTRDAQYAADATKAGAKPAKSMFDFEGAAQSLADALLRGFESGKGFAENFKDTLVNMFKTMILRPSIEFLIKGAVGGIGSMIPGFANASGMGGFGGDGNNLFTSLFSNSGGFNPLSFFAGGMSPFIEGSSSFVGPLMEGAGMIGGLMSTVGAFIPYIGIALAIAGALGAFDSGGGPKQGGFAITPGVQLPSQFAGDNYRYFTPNSADAEMMDVVRTTGKSYDQLFKALGGKGDSAFGLAIGYDTDPEGTASNRAHVGAFVNGKQVYDYKSGDDALGRDAAALQAALEIETKRALLAGLQNSDLPEEIANILNQVAAATATSEQIDNITALAVAYKQIDDLFKQNPMEIALRGFESSTQAFGRMGDDLLKLLDTFDGTAEATQNLQDATNSYYNALIQYLQQIESVRRSLEESFEDARRSIALAVAPDDQSRYNLYDQWLKQSYANLGNATDPESINRYASMAQGNLMNAFNLLSPEDQRKLAPQFLERINQIEQIAQRQLEAARQAALAQAAAIGDAVRTAMDDAAKKIGEGGDAVKSGGDKMAEAATRIANAGVKMDGAAEKIANQHIVVDLTGLNTLVNGGA